MLCLNIFLSKIKNTYIYFDITIPFVSSSSKNVFSQIKNYVNIYVNIYIYSMRELHKAHSASDGNESRNHQDEWGSSQTNYHDVIGATQICCLRDHI